MVQIGARKPLKRCDLDAVSALNFFELVFRIDRSLLKDAFPFFYFLK